ncbi:hypothetical protein LAV73_03205 [Lysinibacillus xylanilyticus]|uniref:hypothetical protein n=1 Tax=Lysinibacillus TaxID=400634 RepID=UPI002B24A93B|nr:hypothetical protein [Lysinibacillus xylanilyticus]MEB2279009.1 hypothetical protein [Lysinibacillus xylanilyticus]UNT56864.1 hypothetical protein ICJ70_07550 [Lysinibacillus capsici]
MRTITDIFDEFDEEYSICEWIQQTQTVQFRDYGFAEVNNEEEFFAMREELFNILFER